MSRRRVFLVIVLVAMALGAQPAAAQSTGTIAGLVTDQTGAALPGVTVRATTADRKLTGQTVTDAGGRYLIADAPPGRVSVVISMIGFGNARRTIDVVAGARVEVNATLQLSLRADVVVTGKRTFKNLADLDRPEESLVGIASAASEGAVTAKQIDARPLMRVGEVLETVPGVVISQHSGEGKANQYYLRGFNLDHGTDFATTVAGVPVNLPSHAHGHGYSDLSFLIPELVTGVQFKKGPYYADEGDFSSAGAANINYTTALERAIVRASVGEDGWRRVVVAGSTPIARGQLLASLDLTHNDGPWTRPDDFRKFNGLLRYSRGDQRNGFSITGMFYDGSWNSTDQVPQRAIDAGIIPRFGGVDDTNGGSSYRHSISAEYQRSTAASITRVSAFGFKYSLNLFSNFTYALDDDLNGDQFEQTERRWVGGGRVTHHRLGRLFGQAADHSVGAQLRYDDIPAIGLYRTAARERLTSVREDAVQQSSFGAFAQTEIRWTPWLRTTQGLRVDSYHFDVRSIDPLNSGSDNAALVSPKGSAVFGPWRKTEFYLNAGGGYHSNDARGATIRRDPTTGEAVEPVTPLVRATGAEVGLRSVLLPRVQLTMSAWRLGLDSELLFIGDAGTTEASRPSVRHGVEITAYARLSRVLSADLDLAFSRARFSDPDPAGDSVPGAAETVIAGGVTLEPWRRLFGSARLRYFGPRPLIEDNSVRSKRTSLVNLEAGYELSPRVRLVLDVFNVFNRKASDIEYFYESRLPGEPAGIADIHTHPTLPRTIRVGVTFAF